MALELAITKIIELIAIKNKRSNKAIKSHMDVVIIL